MSDYHPKADYMRIWKEMLGALLGWSEERVIAWALDRWGEYLDDPHDMFYHENPIYWSTYTLIPDSLKSRLDNLEIIELQGRLLIAFKDKHFYNFPPETDWKPYKERVQQILAEYDERLPE